MSSADLQPVTPEASASPTPLASAPNSNDALAQGLISRLDRETRALGAVPAAAPLFHEMGQLWEQLKSPRNAAICYQNAFRLDPTFIPNIRAARRLFAEVGNWQMASQLLDAELKATQNPQLRAQLHYERGQILEERLAKPDEALAAYEQGLKELPTDLALLCQLELLYASRGDDAKLLPVLVQLAEVVVDEPLRAHYLFQASTLLEDRMDQSAAAAPLLEKALGLRPFDAVLLTALERRAERGGSSEELLRVLAVEAAGLGAQAGPAYYRISRIYERLGRSEDAAGALQAARRAAPGDPLVLSELARLYDSLSRWEELAEVLAARVQILNDESEKAALQMRLAALCEERLNREEEAITRYQAVLAYQPGHQLALTALGKLFFRRKDWAGLLATHEREASNLDDPKVKVTPLYKAAEVLELRLGREDEAVGRYNEILQLMPGYLPAQKALARLFEKHQRWAELAAMYEQDLAQTRDRDQVVATLTQVSSIFEERLGDLERASAALRRILEIAPEHLPTIRALSRLYERSGTWGELIETLRMESAATGDTKQVVSLLHRIAEIQEEKVSQSEESISTYQKVLALSPAYLPALKALGRLYASRGMFDQLIQMYRQEADIAPSIEQAAILTFKIGEIYEDKQKDLDSAVTAYQEVLTLSPSHFAALRALSRIHRSSGNWDSLVEVLRHEAAARTDPGERANTLFQVGAIWEDVGKLELAIEAYQEVLKLSPTHTASLRALERIYFAQGATKELVALYERETQGGGTPTDRIAAFAKLARIHLYKQDEPARAASCFEAILNLDPADVAALKGLERARATDRARVTELRLKLADHVHTPSVSSVLLAAAAQDLDRRGLHEESLELWRQAHSVEANPRTSAGLEAALIRSGDVGNLAALLDEELAREALPSAQVGLAMRIGRLCEMQLGDLPRALSAYATALRIAPQFIPALQAARRVVISQGDFQSAHQGLVAEAEVSLDKGDAVQAWYQAGLMALERLNDPQTATIDLQRALELDPLAEGPSRALDELLARQGGSAAQATLHLKRGEAKLGQRLAEEAGAEFLEAAKLFAGQLRDPASAQTAVERAVAAAPTNAEALTLMGDLCFASGRFPDAVRAFAARVEQGGDRRALAQVHVKLGILYQDHLGEPDRAAAHLQTALADAPDSLEGLERLSRIHVASRNWTAAADVLRRMVDLDTDPHRGAAHMLALARVYDEGFGDAGAAVKLYRQLLEVAPTDAILDRLAALYERLGQTGELAALLERQAQRTSAGGAAALRLKAAGLYARAGDANRAVASLRFAIEADPGAVEPRFALAELLGREPSQALAAIEEYRNVLKLDPFRADAYHALFRLYDATKAVDRQFCVASVLVFLRQANELEALFASDGKQRAAQESQEKLSEAEVETQLFHPLHRGPVGEVLRLIGDQLYKVYPANLDALGVGRGDKLKPDHALARPVRAICSSLGVEKLEVYQGKRGATVTVENTDPQSVVIGPDLVRRYQTRDQRFLFARASMHLRAHSMLAQSLAKPELSQLLGAAMRSVSPDSARAPAADAELTKKIRKALPGKVLRELELLVPEVERLPGVDVAALARGAAGTIDRAGMLYSGDIASALQLVVREDPQHTANRLDQPEAVRAIASARIDVRDLMVFAISDDFFRLRQRLKMGLGT